MRGINNVKNCDSCKRLLGRNFKPLTDRYNFRDDNFHILENCYSLVCSQSCARNFTVLGFENEVLIGITVGARSEVLPVCEINPLVN